MKFEKLSPLFTSCRIIRSRWKIKVEKNQRIITNEKSKKTNRSQTKKNIGTIFIADLIYLKIYIFISVLVFAYIFIYFFHKDAAIKKIHDLKNKLKEAC